MNRQFPEDMANMESILKKEFDENEVTLEKVVYTITSKMELYNKVAPIVMYEKPFSFYVTTSEGSELKFSAKELLESCNSQDCGDTPYFLDIDDMMKELSECLGGDPLSLVVAELKNSDQILSCLRKFG